MERVSAHSGLPESVELRMMAEKAEQNKQKRESQIAAIREILKPMPKEKKKALLAEVIRREFKENWVRRGKIEADRCRGTVKRPLETAPVIDAWPVVRCKDCIEWSRNTGTFTDSPNGHCWYIELTTNQFDFLQFREKEDPGEPLRK